MAGLDGIIAGYDPGGNKKHGLAFFKVVKGKIISCETDTYETAEAVIRKIACTDNLLALGLDTLVAWSTGESGWRPADLWLRDKYKDVMASIVSPNGLYGSMGLNGMAVLLEARKAHPEVYITETHPKILNYYWKGPKYNYTENKAKMDDVLCERIIGCKFDIKNDHEWDAAASAFAAFCGKTETWTHDLLKEKSKEKNGYERMVYPAGEDVHYMWPE